MEFFIPYNLYPRLNVSSFLTTSRAGQNIQFLTAIFFFNKPFSKLASRQVYLKRNNFKSTEKYRLKTSNYIIKTLIIQLFSFRHTCRW